MKRRLLILTAVMLLARGALGAPVLLNASYDVMRDFYKDYNPLFQKAWRAKSGETVTVQQSHGGSSKQILAVVNGLPADVVTMNQASDIDVLATRHLLAANWAQRFPDHSVPFTSTMVLLVRKGNPKHIRDWPDLARPGVQVILANPKTSGNGRYGYLSAWAWALRQPGGSDARARQLVGHILANVPLLDGGGRAATTTFMQRQIGDVLITFENEAEMISREFGRGQFELVYPTLSARADNPVAVVDSVVDKKGSRRQAQAYLDYLWSPEAQALAARYFLRPANPQVAARYAAQFPYARTFDVPSVFGSWQSAMQKHFADGGEFDRLMAHK
ncbi:sulfate ABC transporter substrate-binding protein [Paludibacterium yongneupense]|uniref:sulfate ABC transporter substrate-binding protein n=1 Tax=Paludibacterium yongneupense TaxID=400061 RepID=UPI000428B7F5|nr:sulfate ABC transporter substrate-binding protein [Paludibacterium yongneupense]